MRSYFVILPRKVWRITGRNGCCSFFFFSFLNFPAPTWLWVTIQPACPPVQDHIRNYATKDCVNSYVHHFHLFYVQGSSAVKSDTSQSLIETKRCKRPTWVCFEFWETFSGGWGERVRDWRREKRGRPLPLWQEWKVRDCGVCISIYKMLEG